MAYLIPVTLISRKVMQDKRVVTDFRHLNTKIAKNNSAYPLIKDTFATLGNSKCDALSVLDLKDTFHCVSLSESSKKNMVEFCHVFEVPHIYMKECQWDQMFPHQFGNHI